jgi:DNA-binding Lrp family transcriptional regulator
MIAFRATSRSAGGIELADVQVDGTDLAILRELSADGAISNKALAARVGLPESTCAYRVRALRERGVITGDDVRLDLPALGYPIQAVIKVRLGSHGAEHVNALYDDLVRIPGVLEAIHVAGADDFHLHVAVPSPEALRDLVLQHITVHRVVRQTETQLIFETRRGVGVLG